MSRQTSSGRRPIFSLACPLTECQWDAQSQSSFGLADLRSTYSMRTRGGRKPMRDHLTQCNPLLIAIFWQFVRKWLQSCSQIFQFGLFSDKSPPRCGGEPTAAPWALLVTHPTHPPPPPVP
jgi:hypothetical protein